MTQPGNLYLSPISTQVEGAGEGFGVEGEVTGGVVFQFRVDSSTQLGGGVEGDGGEGVVFGVVGHVPHAQRTSALLFVDLVR